MLNVLIPNIQHGVLLYVNAAVCHILLNGTDTYAHTEWWNLGLPPSSARPGSAYVSSGFAAFDLSMLYMYLQPSYWMTTLALGDLNLITCILLDLQRYLESVDPRILFARFIAWFLMNRLKCFLISKISTSAVDLLYIFFMLLCVVLL